MKLDQVPTTEIPEELLWYVREKLKNSIQSISGKEYRLTIDELNLTIKLIEIVKEALEDIILKEVIDAC